MIIQNLHNTASTAISQIKTGILLVLILLSCKLLSQDSIPSATTVSEDKNLEFQQYFFTAITQKAIRNYQKAIENLEECNVIMPNNTSVLFELSKNYLKLNQTPQALAYINEAITLDDNNLWLSEHAVAIYKRQKNYTQAVIVQQKIATTYPKKKREIVYLHLQNNDTEAAKKVLNELANSKMLDARLRRIQKRLLLLKNIENTYQEKVVTSKNRGSFKEQFDKEKSFTTLEKLLHQLYEEKNSELLGYSSKGLQLFPAQPLVYLMNGRALNDTKNYKKAIESLQNGIDFVIDNETMEKSFYKELIEAYKKLGDTKNTTKYQKKL